MKIKPFKKLFVFLVSFFLYLYPAYALSFNVDASLSKSTVESGDKTKLDFKITNIKNTKVGISSCEMNINLSDGLEIVTDYELPNDTWKSEKGKEKIVFYSTDIYFNDFTLFSTMVKASKSGSINITNIKCFGIDESGSNEESYDYGEKTIRIEVREASPSSSISDVSSSSSSSSSSTKPVPSSSSSSSESSKKTEESSNKVYVLGFNIVGGRIDFEPEVTEYTIYVDSFENVDADPIVPSGMRVKKSDYLLDDDGKKYDFVISDGQGDYKEYSILFLLEGGASINSLIEETTGKKNYTPIFIAIIILLIGVNVYRIISNKKKVIK